MLPLRSSHVSAAATGAATTTRAGDCCRTAAAAARMVEPVAKPSSTRMIVWPSADGV
ncbi:MAG TPA: hypothetical protein VNH11_30740 [Pirellulales bacterium]|nr:hypothetical protein [Pirellulales bacterium]